MNIKDTFISLTTRTYPHGTESELFHLLPQDLETDEFGNLFKQIGESPSTMFTCHLDTATRALVPVNHVFEDNFIKTDGTSILGADDKAGVTVILNMIENKIPGLYYFFLGEEVGCVGSKKLAQKHKDSPIPYIKKVVSFDRRATSSVITFQMSGRCCSETFGNALSEALNKAGTFVIDNEIVLDYQTDPTGVYTDSAQFIPIYSECTNVSVGYYSEHTTSEKQDIRFLDKLAKAVLYVDWESLPSERDPNVVEYRTYSQPTTPRYQKPNWKDYDDDFDYYSRYSNKTKNNEENIWFIDDEFEFVSYVTINKSNQKVIKTDISPQRVELEKDLIGQFLMTLELDNKGFKWDGLKLTIEYEDFTNECDRNDLSEFISELDFWKKELDNNSL